MVFGGNLYIDVTCYAGAHAIREMADLANRLQICVWCELNGIRTLARPGDNPDAIVASWMNASPPHRFASDDTPRVLNA